MNVCKAFGLAPASIRSEAKVWRHYLRHTFGSHAIRTADSREVMEWMGHQDLATTQRYLQFKPRQDAARRISAAFKAGSVSQPRARREAR